MNPRAGRRLALAAALALSGCGGAPERAPAPASEQQSLDRAARLAYQQGRYAQAATLYQRALEAALAEDRPRAIIDARFNLALCHTYLGAYDAALSQLERAEAERQRRTLPVDPQLELLRGTIHYRQGDLRQAQAALDAVLETALAAPATRSRAHFVSGLIAADRADAAALQRQLAALPASDGNPDRLELQGRLAGLQGDIDGGLQLLEQTARQRSLEGDHRGMARALASAGELGARAGRPQVAANYLFRAGRSAAQRQQPQARDWLLRAKALAQRSGDTALVQEAEAALRDLESAD
jgi:tetratricopeptide (TPR) repeat protein